MCRMWSLWDSWGFSTGEQSGEGRGWEGGSRASPSAQASCGSSWWSRALLRVGRLDLSYRNLYLPVASTRLPRACAGATLPPWTLAYLPTIPALKCSLGSSLPPVCAPRLLARFNLSETGAALVIGLCGMAAGPGPTPPWGVRAQPLTTVSFCLQGQSYWADCGFEGSHSCGNLGIREFKPWETELVCVQKELLIVDLM